MTTPFTSQSLAPPCAPCPVRAAQPLPVSVPSRAHFWSEATHYITVQLSRLARFVQVLKWRETKHDAKKGSVHADSQWKTALRSLQDLDESTLKDIGAPPWVISEVDRNRQVASRRSQRVPHI